MIVRLAVALSIVLAAGAAQAQRLPALYAEAGGASGLYAVGLDQLVLRSGDDARRLSVRAGASYRPSETALTSLRQESVLAVPLGVEASFSLGRPFGLAARFDVGTGVVVSRRTSGTGGHSDGTIVPDTYTELAVRVEPSRRLAVRAGLTSSGVASGLVGSGARPVVGVAVGL